VTANNLYGVDLYMAELSDQQQRAADLLSTRPDLTKEKIAEEVGISRQTLYEWQKLPAFAREVKAAIRQIVPVESHRRILDALVKRAVSGDPRAVEAYLKWQLETGAYANIAPEPVDTGPPTINFIIGNDDLAVVDDGKLKALTGVVLGYLADLRITREGLLKELRSVLSEETLALLPAPEEAEELKTLPRAEPNIQRLLSPDQKSAGMEAARCRVETHTGESGLLYVQGPKETEKMFWERVNKNEMLEEMRQQ